MQHNIDSRTVSTVDLQHMAALRYINCIFHVILRDSDDATSRLVKVLNGVGS
jgi:hypothetical protein